MPGDPKECRMRAARCAEFAAAVKNPQLKMWFLNLSKSWEALAIELEDGFARFAEVEALSSDVRKSLDELKQLSSSLDPRKCS